MSKKAFAIWITSLLAIGALALIALYVALGKVRDTAPHPGQPRTSSDGLTAPPGTHACGAGV